MLSPLVTDLHSLETLTGPRVASLVIEPESTAATQICYGHSCRVRLFRIILDDRQKGHDQEAGMNRSPIGLLWKVVPGVE